MTFRRAIELKLRVADPGETDQPSTGALDIIASTDAPCSRYGGWSEVLSHMPDAIDSTACRALLLNHNPDQIIGGVESFGVESGRSIVGSKLLDGAMLPTGVTVAAAIEAQALRGVSIGYSYDEQDCTIDEESRTLTANKWRLLEVSLTPIPADPAAMIRSALPDFLTRAFPALPKKVPAMSEPVVSAVTATVAGPDPVTVARHAEDLGLRASDYLGKPDWQTAMLGDAAKSRAKTPTAAPSIQILEEDGEKLQKQAIDGLLSGRGIKAAIEFARRSGVETGGWDRSDVAEFMFPSMRGTRVAEVSANFTQVTQLAGNKAMKDAYDRYAPVWNLIADSQTTSDFKAVRTAALQFGDLAVVTEGNAATDITVDDAGGSGALTYRGGLLELTKQAIYNDELGIFFKRLGQIGQIGGRHVDKSVFAALAAANFASATSVLALNSANLATAWAAHMAITGPAGEIRANPPARLVVPSALYVTSKEITTVALGESTARVFAAGEDYIRPVHGLFLADTNDWYLLADPAFSPAFTVLFHTDYESPKMFEIDAGASISRKFRIEFPLAVIANTDGTNKPMGGFKCTQP